MNNNVLSAEIVEIKSSRDALSAGSRYATDEVSLERYQFTTIGDKPERDSACNSRQSLSPSPVFIEEAPDFGKAYEIIEFIGSGGMGCVYKVRETRSGAVFAIKVISGALAQDVVAQKRFEQEVEAASLLDHPNLVSVYGHGRTVCGKPYMVMEYLDGQNLDKIIKDEGRLDPSRSIDLLIQIVEGLQCAHRQEIVHRDIKPTNIIVCKTESGEIAKLLDFGISMVLPAVSRETRDLTRTGEIFGSPQYMSPEQCLSSATDQRSDIYSIGCLMYAMIVGRPPFESATVVRQIVGHVHEDPKPFGIVSRSPHTLMMLQRIAFTCLEKKPENRYQHASDLLKELDLVKNGRMVPYRIRIKSSVPMESFVSILLLLLLILFVASSLGNDFLQSAVSRPEEFFIGLWAVVMIAMGFAIFQLKRRFKNGHGTPQQWLHLAIVIGGALLASTSLISACIDSSYKSSLVRLPDLLLAIDFFASIFQNCLVVLLGAVIFALPGSAKQQKRAVCSRLGGWFVYVASCALLTQFSNFSLFESPASRAEKVYPDLAIALYRLSDSVHHKKSCDRHLLNSSLDRIIPIQENNGRIADAIETVSEKIKREVVFNYRSRVQRAKLYLEIGQVDKAEADIRSISEHDSSQERYALGWLGIIASVRGDLDGAMRHYEKSLEIDPSFSNDSYFYRISSLCRAKQYGRALKYTEATVRIWDYQPYSLFLRGLIFEQMGDAERARAEFKKLCSVMTQRYKNSCGESGCGVWAYALHQLGDIGAYEDKVKDAAGRDKVDIDQYKYQKFPEGALVKYSGMKLNW